jgi:hypothetical protein
MNLRFAAPFCSKLNLAKKGNRLHNLSRIIALNFDFGECEIFSAKLRTLKVFINEKEGGLEVVAFDRSPFKLFNAEIFRKIGTVPIF